MSLVSDALDQAQRILLCLHAKPDGDAVGSNLAMALALGRAGKEVLVVSADPVPSIYSFLPGAGQIAPWSTVEGRTFDAVLALDLAEVARAKAPHELHHYAPRVINVDHHGTNPRFGDVNLVDPLASSVGELVIDLLDSLHLVIDKQIALCLYTAISTDTGKFSFDTTSPETHRKTARLLDAGVESGEVSTQLYENLKLGTLRLLGLALSTLSLHLEGKVALMRLQSDAIAKLGLDGRDAESLEIVGFARSVQGALVGALLRDEAGQVRVSLRSRPGVDVGQVAHRLGGGGHPQAAGITLADCTLDEAQATVLAALVEALPGR